MSENKQTTDSELLLQIVGYNSEAFEQLYNRYSATVYSLIKEIITNPKLAEKILLNVFSVFLKRIDYYCTTSNDVYTWLTLLTRNISIDALKRMKFVEDIPIYSDDYEIESILPNLSQVITPINLEDRAILGEKIKLYKSHLTEVQNLVLSLVYFEGLNEEEIAKRLSVPVVTVRQKVLSIMESLHHQYTGHTEDVKINKEVLSLIKLEALGCLSSEERILFNEIRKNDPDFLWKELGEYQNLTALLATPIPLQNPGHELNGEIKEVFTKILQGSEVDYPIIAPEPPLVNQFQEPIPELIKQQIQNPISEVIKQPEIQETKKTGFELKFRERDPKELSILKKIETVESKPQPTPVVAKKETEIQFRNYKTADKKQVGFNDRKNSSTEVREAISAVIKNEVSIQNKTTAVTTEKSNLQIENDDPSIVIEEPKQTEVKEDITVKNRLIPNSSINLKEFFKKDESTIVNKEMMPVKTVEEKKVAEIPLEPVVQKPDIIIKTNEPPKEFKRSSVFVDKNANLSQSKPVIPVVQKPLVENKTNGSVKENQKLNTEIVKEEKTVIKKSVEPVLQKPDIIIKTNEPPKEFKRSSVFVDKNENTIQSKPVTPVIQDPTLENKTNEQVKEIQKSTVEVVQEEKKVVENPVVPIVQKPDIIINANEPPKEFIRNSALVDRNENLTQSKPVVPSVQKPSVGNRTNEPVKETQKSNTDIVKEENSIEIKSQLATTKHDIKIPIQSINQKEKINSTIKKDEKLFERINPSADRSNLKIRETVFAENEKKTEILQQETSTVKSDSNSKTEKIDPPGNLKEAINIDEILSNIEDEKPAPVVLSESESYQKEIVRLRKKIKRNILVSAAVFAILASTSVFVYFQFQKAPVKVANKITNSENINLTEQINPNTTKETTPEILTETPVVTSTSVISEQPVTNKKVTTPPLPEFSTKEESTLFAAKVNNNSLSSYDDKQIIQTAAAKTETTIPPKEIKKVEEEPAFFVAVEEMPELIGGIKGLQSKIVYPEIAKRVGIEGKVIVQAIVDETGKVISVNTLKGIGSGCDEVAMDAVRNSQFIPGKQRGKTVKTQVTIPIVFKK